MAIAPEVIEALPEIVSEGESLAPDIAYLFRAAGSGAGQGALWAADLVGAAVCILALIFAFAITLLLRALAAIFGFVPFIGGWIRDNIVNVGISAIGAVTGWIEGALGTLVGVVWAPVRWLGSIVSTIFAALYEAGEMGIRIVTQTVPNAIGWVYGQAQRLVQALRSYVDGSLAWIRQWVATLINEVRDWVNQYIAVVQRWVVGLLDTAIAGVNLRIGQIITWAQQNFSRVEQDIANGVRTAENYTTQVGQGITTRLEREIQTRVQPLEDKLRNCEQDMCATINEAKRLQNATDFLPIDHVPVGWVLETAFSARTTAAEAVTFATPLLEAISAAVRAELRR